MTVNKIFYNLLLVMAMVGLMSVCTMGKASTLHSQMTEEELVHFFGHDNRDQIDQARYEIIRMVRNDDNLALPLVKFDAFSRSFALRMRQNSFLVSPMAELVVQDDERSVADLDEHVANCHFLVHDQQGQVQGGLSHCFDQFSGILFHDDEERRIYEIKPLGPRLSQNLDNSTSGSELHFIRHVQDHENEILDKIDEENNNDDSEESENVDNEPIDIEVMRPDMNSTSNKSRRKKRSASNRALMAELAVFVDPDAYNILMRFFRNDESRLTASVLAIVNGMQAVYHYPSLGRKLEFTVVRLELLKRAMFSSHGGERNELLNSFCQYQMGENNADDNDPRHWDASLLMSGVDFYGLNSKGKKSYATMGLATVTGVCEPRYSCVIGELAVLNRRGYPSPSTGFSTIYVMAHEIGHNLGMTHDSSKNSPLFVTCPKNGFVMSPSRGLKGELEWSRCSRTFMSELDLPCLHDTPINKLQELDHSNRYGNEPGRRISADRQCQFALHNRDAVKDNEVDSLCERSLVCTIPNQIGRFTVGPAMDGTRCGNGRICRFGACIHDDGPQELGSSGSPPATDYPSSSSSGELSAWSGGRCEFNCIGRSKGVKVERRQCLPEGAECSGARRRASFCDDVSSSHCGFDIWPNGKEYASEMCRRYRGISRRLNLLITDEGHQPKHNPGRASQACTIHCRMSRTPAWYSPQAEISDLGNQGDPDKDISLYFPDGTMCHDSGDRATSLFCLDHVCSSSNAVLTTRMAVAAELPAVHVGGVGDEEHAPSEQVQKFFTLDEHDQPLLNDLQDQEDQKEEQVELDDELMIP